MVKVSHARCRQCGQARHRNARFNLCGRCWQARKAELQSGWHDIKDRRAAKRLNGTAPQEEPMVLAAQLPEEENALPRGRANPLTPEQELEIVSLYTTTDTSVREIASTYGIHETQPFQILNKNGISWRRGDSKGRTLPPHIEAMKGVHVAPTPAPRSVPSVEGMPVAVPTPPLVMQEALVEAFDKVFPPEVVAAANDERPTWRVEFSGFREVRAESARDAIAAAEELGATEVTFVRKIS